MRSILQEPTTITSHTLSLPADMMRPPHLKFLSERRFPPIEETNAKPLSPTCRRTMVEAATRLPTCIRTGLLSVPQAKGEKQPKKSELRRMNDRSTPCANAV